MISCPTVEDSCPILECSTAPQRCLVLAADFWILRAAVEAQITELSLLQQSLTELERTHLKIKQNVSLGLSCFESLSGDSIPLLLKFSIDL